MCFWKNINGKCEKCNQKKYNSKQKWTRKCSVCNTELIYKQKSHYLRAVRENRKCRFCANDHSHDEEFKRKQRISKIRYLKRVSEFQVKPTFNESACEYFDKLSKKKWSLQHAKNGGEFYVKDLGYWLDAYDKNKNVVVEYDEPKHFTKTGELKKKDIDRMVEICNHLKCEFWRYNEKKGTLKKYEY